MKPKAALVKDGFVEGDHTWSPGDENKRGRLSGGAIERCMQLAAEGWQIDGYVATASTGPEPKTEVSKVKVDPNRIQDVPEPARDEDSWTAHSSVGPVGMRTVCNICKSSLTYCHCPNPRVWLDHENESMVVFKVKG